MASSPSRPPVLLLTAFVAGVVGVGLNFWGLEGIPELAGLMDRFFESLNILGFNLHNEAPRDDWRIIGAGLCALVAGASAFIGVVIELSPQMRAAMQRLRLRLERLRRRPVVVIGLGWIGGVLAAQIRRKGRPVYALALDAHSTRAETARLAGVFVEEGDATTDDALDELPLTAAREVFIATGDDVRNVEIAGAILEAYPKGRRGKKRTVYVHVSDPSIGNTVGQRGLLPTTDGQGTTYRLFSVLDTAAFDLAKRLYRTLVPTREQQVVHVVLIGFGTLGQTIALRLARLLHGTNRRRLRLTVLHRPDERGAVERFRALHPGFGPEAVLREPGADRWASDSTQLRPGPRAWHTRDAEPEAIEFAVLAEFVESRAFVSPETVELVSERFASTEGTEVNGALVVATDDEHLNVRVAVGLQDALATERGWPPDRPVPDPLTDPAADWPPPPIDALPAVLPLYPYLFDETGLAALVDREAADLPASKGAWKRRYRALGHPIRPFGFRRETAAYEVVTDSTQREDAERLHATYHILTGGDPADPIPPSFQISNLDAAAFADLVLERYFYAVPTRLSAREAAVAGVYPEPLIAPPAVPRFVPPHQDPEDGPEEDQAVVVGADAYALLATVASEPLDTVGETVKRRFATERDAIGPDAAGPGTEAVAWAHYLHPALRRHAGEPETPERRAARAKALDDLGAWARACIEHAHHRAAMRVERQQYSGTDASPATRAVIAAFDAALAQSGTDLARDLAEAEHHRWMAERLVFGWRHGARSDARRRRATFCSWEAMTDEDRLHDRAHLPRLILERQGDLGEADGLLYYLRREPLVRPPGRE